ncbi:MAG: flagellar hook-associated protein 3 [Spirochaetaceae bacterium]
MNRISTNMPNDNTQFFMRRQESDRRTLMNQISSQRRIQDPRDAPLSAAHATRYDSFATRLNRYSNNIEYAQDNVRVTEGHMRSAVDIMQRIRELAVQGANGTFTAEDTRQMAVEVDELLEELVEIANSDNGTGGSIFAGARTDSDAFQVLRGNVEGADGLRITEVLYNGDITVNRAEIGDNAFIDLNIPGNDVFWAENQTVSSNVDVTDYVATQDSVMHIDGVEVRVNEGDSVFAVMDRINESGAAVQARLDPVNDGLVLETTTPHQLWLQDSEGTVLEDLGVVAPGGGRPPANTADGASVFGGSLFDMVISLRDDLLDGRQIDAGGRSLAGIDAGLNNMLGRMARLGAQDSRLSVTYDRVSQIHGEIRNQLSREVDIDMAQAITDLQMMEYSHRAALGAAGRLLPQTLLDFLR